MGAGSSATGVRVRAGTKARYSSSVHTTVIENVSESLFGTFRQTLSERNSGAWSFGIRGPVIAISDPNRIQLKSLILAQIERWRHALHMQVERERGATPE